MKILQVISSGGMYGAEAVILDLSRSLGRSGHQSVLGVFANLAQLNTELVTRARSEGIETYPIPCHGQLDRAVPARLRDLVRETGAEIVHGHGYKADVYAYWALRGTKTALVATCHNWIDNSAALRAYGVLDRLALRSFRGVVAVSDGVRKRLLKAGVPHSKVSLIPNGLDLGPFAAIERRPDRADSDPLTVGVAARLSREKGVDVFLRAAALVREQLPGTRFVVGGDGADRAELQRLIEETQMVSSARLLGRQEDMPTFYAGLDLLVLPSRMEGLPMALLEGMASGLAVVATKVGEMPEVVQDGVTGLLVPKEDPLALAEAIMELLRDSARRHEMGVRGRARVAEAFSAEAMTARYIRFYEEALAGGRS